MWDTSHDHLKGVGQLTGTHKVKDRLDSVMTGLETHRHWHLPKHTPSPCPHRQLCEVGKRSQRVQAKLPPDIYLRAQVAFVSTLYLGKDRARKTDKLSKWCDL